MWLLRLLLSLALLGAPGAAWALQPVYVDQLGARPDGIVRTDCAMTAASAVLTCTAARFTATDVGKVIAVYGAKTANAGYAQVLQTTIASRQSPTQVTLAVAANVTVNPSSRVIYGTDSTATIQRIIDTTVAAPDGRGGNVGGQVIFGPGTYLVSRLTLPCARIGTFINGTCTRTYNNIALQGAGQFATTLENFDPSLTTGPAGTTGLIYLAGATGDPSSGDGNALLSGFTLSDMTLHQVLNSPESLNVVSARLPLTDARFERLVITGTAYEGLVVGGQRVVIRDNYASGNGTGGPAFPQILSSYNITSCIDCLFSGNRWDTALGGAGYPAEFAFARSLIQGNQFTCPPAGGQILFSNNVQGTYDVTIAGNTIRNCTFLAVNSAGVLNRIYIRHNTFVNSPLQIQGGVDTNTVPTVNYPDTIGHGPSTIDGNTFVRDGTAARASSIQLGYLQTASQSQESWLLANNTFLFRATVCDASPFNACMSDGDCSASACGLIGVTTEVIGLATVSGGQRWAPSTACVVGTTWVYPVVYNGYYYKCTTAGTTGTTEPTWPTTIASTVSDGSAVWTLARRKPTITLHNNTIQGPDSRAMGWAQYHALLFWGDPGPDRDSVRVIGMSANFPWVVDVAATTRNATVAQETVPAGALYGDLNRFLAAPPVLGHYQISTIVNNTAPSAGQRGWVATRAGRAGSTWATGTAYAFGAWVVPTADNAHAYTQRTAAGCTSHASTQPTWPTGSGATVSDGTCSWKESGAAVLWLQF